eukprot:2718405-Ditylum_brightwellii.AAC.1
MVNASTEENQTVNLISEGDKTKLEMSADSDVDATVNDVLTSDNEIQQQEQPADILPKDDDDEPPADSNADATVDATLDVTLTSINKIQQQQPTTAILPTNDAAEQHEIVNDAVEATVADFVPTCCISNNTQQQKQSAVILPTNEENSTFMTSSPPKHAIR